MALVTGVYAATEHDRSTLQAHIVVWVLINTRPMQLQVAAPSTECLRQ